MNTITITIENPEKIVHDLADLLCWWQGYKCGLKAAGPYTDTEFVADNGIEAARKLSEKIKEIIYANKINP